MKALKSQLATELLADPKARDQLRQFLVAKRPQSSSPTRILPDKVQIQREGGMAVTARVVPKAKVA